MAALLHQVIFRKSAREELFFSYWNGWGKDAYFLEEYLPLSSYIFFAYPDQVVCILKRIILKAQIVPVIPSILSLEIGYFIKIIVLHIVEWMQGPTSYTPNEILTPLLRFASEVNILAGIVTNFSLREFPSPKIFPKEGDSVAGGTLG